MDETLTLNFHQKSLVRSLLYYDSFKHPLSLQELQNCLENKEEIHIHLEPLLEVGIVFKSGDYYSISKLNSEIDKREDGQKMAISAMPKAIRRAEFIFNFPYVKGVYISGSVSKGVLEDDGDVDYFIVTKPGRLWLSRSLLILFKKVFLFNSRKFFCLNYFVDSNHLEIEEKNVFTATELLTLIPVFQDGVHDKFMRSNEWVGDFYPNQKMKELDVITSKIGVKLILEFLFSGPIGNWLDGFLMKLTMNVWKRKFEDFEPPDFNLALKSRTYVSKHHPHNYQKKVLDAFEIKKLELEQKFNIDLSL